MNRTKETALSSRMGEAPEGKLLLSISVPIMLSMTVQALYNIVDSIYVAAVSEDCLTAISLAFPVQNILIGIATGTGVGIATLISRALGRRDSREVSRVAGTSIFLCFCCWFLMLIVGIFFAKPFINSQTDSEAIRAYGDSYLQIVCIGSLFLYFQICTERLLQVTGLTKLFMWSQMTGAVTNIILDPFFIYGWCGLPAMNTTGAAVATIIGQAVGASLGMYFHLTRNKEIKIHLSDIRPNTKIIADTYRIGIPSIMMVGVGSVTTTCMNKLLMSFSSTAVAVYGSYSKMTSFFFMPIFGLNNGLTPIIGYNYGARKKERIYRVIKFGVLYAVIIMSIGTLLFTLIPDVLLSIFNPSEHMLEIGRPALRIISIHFPLAAVCIVFGSVCQALDRSVFSFLASFIRQILALLPAAYLLSRTGNVNMIWWAFPIAELFSVTCTSLFVRNAFNGMEEKLDALKAEE